ncbi:class II fructose-bisphosphatase [Phenylobacterium sp.]|uniref:class II fructose-bisphosphatase n=1 Tax=Phenylobacterium sp. TaxID=1871053 RepID=UPI0025E049C1|nr:class II fructose-bisphosphatase [Phenylobacterium sp.]MBX3485552.1 class II fructose-bisphosphatase [Phenylobacterium sp.]
MSSQVLDRNLIMDAVRVCEAAAIAAWQLVGRGDEKAADQAAVDAMRTALNDLDIDGEIVIGEGERDEAPMLYIGEKVGKGKGAKIDIALDPLEGTTLTAKAMANALAVMAWAPKGTLLNAPDTYMDKIACGPGYPAGVIDLDKTPAENVAALAKAKGVDATAITVCILDRPRHAEIIASVRSVGARVHLITDGDVAGVINTADPETGIDMYVGSGGAPEGVLACAALKCVGGQFQGRLVFRNADERARAARVGITDLDKKYDLHEMVRADAIFAATGVTKGALLDGVRVSDGFVHTHTLVMNSASHTVREVRMKRPV